MKLPESTFEDDIEEFFELIITDKRLTMIDNGFVDLKINHSTKMIVDEDEDEDMLIENEEDIEEENSEDNYDDDYTDDSDADLIDDDYADLTIVDDEELEDEN